MELLFTNVPVLFFFLGVLAHTVRSDLEIPPPLPKLFSLYLLLAIGLKGGFNLASAPPHLGDLWLVLGALGLGILIPVLVFFLAKLKLSVPDAAGVAASFGSVSAVTFVTAGTFLQNQGLTYSGLMVGILALLEAPAIVVALILARIHHKDPQDKFSWGKILHEGFLGGAVVLLLGALGIAFLAGSWNPQIKTDLSPFYQGALFQGILCFFLLDLGLLAARKFQELQGTRWFLVVLGLGTPWIGAVLAGALSLAFHLKLGEALLLTVMAASASYIAVPAALRQSLPQANPGVFLSMALGITFPFNVAIGIPLYFQLLKALGVQP